MAAVNWRFWACTSSMVKGPLSPMRISVMAGSFGLSGSFRNSIFRTSVPLMVAIAHPSPTPCCCAWPPGSRPSMRAPVPFVRCVFSPKPGDFSLGEAKLKGPTLGSGAPPGATIRSAQTSSGAMIFGVPTQVIAKESPATSLATPKSTSFAWEPAPSSFPHSRMFSHLRSRWSTCLECRNFTAATTCLKMPFAEASSRPPFAATTSASSPPSTSSVTISLYFTIVRPCMGPWRITVVLTSQQPMQAAMPGWPWARIRAEVSRSRASARPSMSSSYTGTAFTA
mmetsp:Transcript_84705/g.182587  ORF Transcript_84705/g.182587 Transcript_84705/m.182587 type:complete len:282 (-) Transcript_84705:184-1029(-)